MRISPIRALRFIAIVGLWFAVPLAANAQMPTALALFRDICLKEVVDLREVSGRATLLGAAERFGLTGRATDYPGENLVDFDDFDFTKGGLRTLPKPGLPFVMVVVGDGEWRFGKWHTPAQLCSVSAIFTLPADVVDGLTAMYGQPARQWGEGNGAAWMLAREGPVFRPIKAPHEEAADVFRLEADGQSDGIKLSLIRIGKDQPVGEILAAWTNATDK